MDLFDVVKSCFRRWYIVLPLLLIAAWFSHNIYNSAKPVYYSNAVIGIAQPNALVAEGDTARNGLLDLGGAPLIANMMVIQLKDPAVVAQVVAGGGEANYSAKMFPIPEAQAALPLVMIEAEEPDPIAAVKTVDLVAKQADVALRVVQQQAAVRDDRMVRAFVVSPPSPPAAAMPSRTRSTISVLAAGAGLAIVVGVLFDVLMMSWKARRQARRQTRERTADTTDAADTAAETSNAREQDRQGAAKDEVAADS